MQSPSEGPTEVLGPSYQRLLGWLSGGGSWCCHPKNQAEKRTTPNNGCSCLPRCLPQSSQDIVHSQACLRLLGCQLL